MKRFKSRVSGRVLYIGSVAVLAVLTVVLLFAVWTALDKMSETDAMIRERSKVTATNSDEWERHLTAVAERTKCRTHVDCTQFIPKGTIAVCNARQCDYATFAETSECDEDPYRTNCATIEVDCNDGLDDDENGLADSDDPHCKLMKKIKKVRDELKRRKARRKAQTFKADISVGSGYKITSIEIVYPKKK